MAGYSICQRCFEQHDYSWNVNPAEFHVGKIAHWKVQLCARCTPLVEQAVLAALKGDKSAPLSSSETPEPHKE